MNYVLNWGIILFGDMKIEGYVDFWEVHNTNGTITVVIEGVKYKTGVNNVLLMHKE